MILNSLEKSILTALAYFSLMDYPLTLLEIQTFLEQKADLLAISQALRGAALSALIGEQFGFYFFKDQPEILRQRQRRYVLAQKKIQRALRVVKLLSFFPWVRAVALYSSLSFFNSGPESDIDLFIIGQKDRLWSARFFLNSFLKIFHLRPRPGKSRNQVCLSFLVAEDQLDLAGVNNAQELVYLYGTARFVFLYQEKDLAQKFFAANSWLTSALPNWRPYQIGPLGQIKVRGWSKKVSEKILGWFFSEKWCQKIQSRLLPARIKELKNLDSRVVINEKMIKLHDNDRRPAAQAAFREKMAKLLNYEQTLGEN